MTFPPRIHPKVCREFFSQHLSLGKRRTKKLVLGLFFFYRMSIEKFTWHGYISSNLQMIVINKFSKIFHNHNKKVFWLCEKLEKSFIFMMTLYDCLMHMFQGVAFVQFFVAMLFSFLCLSVLRKRKYKTLVVNWRCKITIEKPASLYQLLKFQRCMSSPIMKWKLKLLWCVS